MQEPGPILTTERCRLRPIDATDAEYVWSASRHPGFTDGMLWNPPETMEEIHTWTERTLARWGEEYAWTIETLSEEFLGRISLRKTEESDVWNIGYWLHPTVWGKGYMTEALTEVVRFGFEDVHAHSITSAHASWNEKSGKVLRRAGFKRVGSTDCGFMKNGKPVPEDNYRITREEFPAFRT